jgi:hypothetical protein
VFRATITNTASILIAEGALQTIGETTWIPWADHVEFGIDSDQAKAILSSPNGGGVAWFLINHKAQLGLKTIKSVSLWAADSEEAKEFSDPLLERAIVFEIMDVS